MSKLRDEVISIITDKIATLQKIDPNTLNEQTNFVKDLSIKSGDLVLVIGAIEDEYDCYVDFMVFRKKATIGAAADYVVELLEG